MAFTINIPNKSSFILILNIDAKAATYHDPIRQLIYTYIGFKSLAIPSGIDLLSYITGIIEININFI